MKRTYTSSDARKEEGLSVAGKHRQVAALLGAGLSPERVATELNMTKAAVKKVHSRKVRYNVDGLKDVWLKAREKHAPKMMEVADAALDRMKAGLADPKTPVHHAAACLREVANASGYMNPEAVVEERNRLQIDWNDPMVVREIFDTFRRGSDGPMLCARCTTVQTMGVGNWAPYYNKPLCDVCRPEFEKSVAKR